MKVSVTLHTSRPDQDGNQRDHEARYQNYNRQYSELVVDPTTGNATCEFDAMPFPRVPDEDQVFTWFSLGVCVAPADQGGAIIIAGPLAPALVAPIGTIPQLVNVSVGVYKARLDKMRADGRLFDQKIDG